ncbi:MAG: DUF1828 domain-containing protein [Bacteroidales bacterium]|jgi:hypothetical protein|nr:DUF1828 domain-containing protein [Bacteroidales bacterium]
MDIQKMISDYTAWLRKEITTAAFGEYAELTTPYMDRFNDYLQIYVKQDANGIITLTDDGYIVGNLISSGMKFNKGSSRRKALDKIAMNFNVSIVDEAITTTASVHNFPQKKHMMVQAMLAVDDLYVASPENIKELFLEDVETYFNANEIYFSKDLSLLGKSGTLHNYDFHFQRTREKPQRFCKGFNRLNRSKRDSTLFSWIDTLEKREDAGELIVIYNDDNAVTDEVLAGFGNYGIKTVPFSEREETGYLGLFAA